jgi:hypothetical protein
MMARQGRLKLPVAAGGAWVSKMDATEEIWKGFEKKDYGDAGESPLKIMNKRQESLVKDGKKG